LNESHVLLTQDNQASIILGSFLKDIEGMVDNEDKTEITKYELEDILLSYKTKFEDQNLERRIELLKVNSDFLENLNCPIESVESISDIRSFSSNRDINSSINNDSLSIKHSHFRKMSESKLFKSPTQSFNQNSEKKSSRDKSCAMVKPFVSYMEVDISVESNGIGRKMSASAPSNELIIDTDESEYQAKFEKLENRLRNEVRFLINQNYDLKLLIENMKVFVPIQFHTKVARSHPKSWETAAKIHKQVNKSAEKPEETQLQMDVLNELMKNHQTCHQDMTQALEKVHEEKRIMKHDFSAVTAKCESFQEQIDKAILSERQAIDKYTEMLK